MKYVIFMCAMYALNFPGFLNFNLNLKIHSYIKNIWKIVSVKNLFDRRIILFGILSEIDTDEISKQEIN